MERQRGFFDPDQTRAARASAAERTSDPAAEAASTSGSTPDAPDTPGTPDAPDTPRGDDAAPSTPPPTPRATSPKPSAPDRPIGVSALNARIKDVLTRGFERPIRVVGELSNLSRRHHWYFTLKDETSSISCVAWQSTASRFGFVPTEGDAVIARARVDHWTTGGRTQLYVDRLEPAGAGTLKQQFDALCRELRGLGWFDDASKRPLPALPRRIAVITSATGAAIRDVVETARQRLPAVGLVLYDVRVQGQGAAPEVAAALRRVQADAARLGIDAIIVTRGGGSLEDLWAFNERAVAEAVRSASLPVVAAIGHESDTTIIELVADRRASTPTQAAMLLVPSRAELAAQLDHLDGRRHAVLRRRLEVARSRVESQASRPVLARPQTVLAPAAARLDRSDAGRTWALRTRLEAARRRLHEAESRWRAGRPERLHAERGARLAMLDDRLGRALRRRIERARDRVPDAARISRSLGAALARRQEHVTRLAGGLALIDPQAVLRRGYTWTERTADGGLVRGPADAPVGTRLATHGSDGIVHSEVTARSDSDTSAPAPADTP